MKRECAASAGHLFLENTEFGLSKNQMRLLFKISILEFSNDKSTIYIQEFQRFEVQLFTTPLQALFFIFTMFLCLFIKN